ncbi:MAG: M20/M25/M40 family metallo-hydrolase, partial [Anaerolineales bacterium]
PGEIPVRLEGEALYGRGAVDAKGPLAAMVDAVAAVGPVAGWQWIVVGAVDEEGDSRGARHIVGKYRPAAVIVGEPSRWDRVTLGYKGSVWAAATVRRPMAHSASDRETAPEAALAFWQAVNKRAQERNRGRTRIFDQVSPSLRAWDSGDDGFESWARLDMGARLPPGVRSEEWLAELRGLDEAVEIDADGFAVPAYRGEKNSRLVRAFLRAIRAHGGQPSFVLKTGTADLNIVAPAWGCPALAYGPGDSTLDHTPDEHILLSEYGRAVGVLAEVLRWLVVTGLG